VTIVTATRQWGTEWTPTDELYALLEPPAWHARALCRLPECSPELWFPEGNDPTGLAVLVCHHCPVIDQCRDFALAQGGELQGIWAGTTQRERRRLLGAEG
jgi:hypothetical protein